LSQDGLRGCVHNIRAVQGHEPMYGTFSLLLDRQLVLLEDTEALDCPVCLQIFQRDCLMKLVWVWVPKEHLCTDIRFWVCTSMHPGVAAECGFVVPVSFSGEERAELAIERVAYLLEREVKP